MHDVALAGVDVITADHSTHGATFQYRIGIIWMLNKADKCIITFLKYLLVHVSIASVHNSDEVFIVCLGMKQNLVHVIDVYCE